MTQNKSNMKSKTITSVLGFLALFAGAQILRAGTHTWSGAQDGYWSNPGNWSSGGPPSAFELAPRVVQFPSSGVGHAVMTNDIPDLWLEVLYFFGSNYKLQGEEIILTGAQPPFPYAYNVSCSGTNVVVWSEFELWNNVVIAVSTNKDLALNGSLHGAGGFTKVSPGKLMLEGLRYGPNTYAGVTTVLDGTLELLAGQLGFFGNGPTVAVPGALVIGDTNMAHSPVVSPLYDGQFGGAPLVINPNGTLDLWAHMEVASLTMTGGAIDLSDYWYVDWGFEGEVPAALAVHSNFASKPTPLSTATVSASYPGAGLVLAPTNGPQAVLDCQGDLIIGASILQVAQLVKSGPANLYLNGTNQYAGDTIIATGSVFAGGETPFGPNASASVTISNGAQLIANSAFTAPNNFHLNGFGANRSGALIVDHDGATFNGALHLDSDTAVVVSNPAHTGIATFLDGAGTLRKRGAGSLQFAGSAANQMAGAMIVEAGTLQLNKTAGMDAVTSTLVIGQGPGAGAADVRFLNDYQLPATLPITLNTSGTLNLNDFYQNGGALTLQGGNIQTFNGVLSLTSDVLATNAPGSTISGNLWLGFNKRMFHIAPGYSLNIFAQISDNAPTAGFDLDGGGTLTLSGSNQFSGPITAYAGVLYARNDHALGQPSGSTTIASGARLAIDGRNLGSEPIILNGDGGNGYGALSCAKTNTISGLVTLASDATLNVVNPNDRLIFSGAVNGPKGLTKIGPGTLILTGNPPNTYGGITTLSEGTLELSKGNIAVPGTLIIGDNVSAQGSHVVRILVGGQLAPSAPVTINSSGVLDLSSALFAPQTIGSLAGGGPVKLGVSPLTVGGDNTDKQYDGLISGTGNFIKQGAGKLILGGGSMQFFGSTVVNGGALSVINWIPSSPVSVNAGGRLMGSGLVGNVTSLSGTISPGCCPTFLKLNSKNLSLDPASTFPVALGGTTPGLHYSQLAVNGTVDLGGASLIVTLGFNSSVSNKFTIIDNDGNDAVAGTFKNLPEGAALVIGGAQFQITYQGGDGNDVVLTQITAITPPHIGTIQKLPNGSMQIDATGLPNATYNIEATDNLTPPQWTSIGTSISDAQGNLQLIDADAPSHSMRFYRLTSL